MEPRYRLGENCIVYSFINRLQNWHLLVLLWYHAIHIFRIRHYNSFFPLVHWRQYVFAVTRLSASVLVSSRSPDLSFEDLSASHFAIWLSVCLFVLWVIGFWNSLCYQVGRFSSSFICQEHIQHNVQEWQIAHGRCDKAEVQHPQSS